MHRLVVHSRKAVLGGILFALLLGVMAVAPAFGNDQHPRAVAGLTELLNKLDKALDSLPTEKFPALEEQLAGIGDLLSELIDALATPGEKPEPAQIVRLDLMLHRLVFILEGIKNRAPQGKKHEAFEDMRVWIDGYITGITARMDKNRAREFASLARVMLKDVGQRIAHMAGIRPGAGKEPGRIEPILRRLKPLLHRLDIYIIRNFGRPPAE